MLRVNNRNTRVLLAMHLKLRVTHDEVVLASLLFILNEPNSIFLYFSNTFFISNRFINSALKEKKRRSSCMSLQLWKALVWNSISFESSESPSLVSFSLLVTLFYEWTRRLKGKRANIKAEVTRKQNTLNFPKKEHFVPPDTQTYQGLRNGRFLENLACFVFFLLPFWDSPFCLITDK